ncbi:TonB-dependent receptor [Arthrospiribacter ruber]|uniref:TonB-dependent receptor n=1 Tax=Arthrospiribacter ruber TaxID=2487934 RepID=A0A951J077_9BACT|nr:TonB-dependent receptor [Arthrospiribacter ruber]MBW3469564.1 TonB-dependent receptor [Arthrospiribacter ruber]
MKVQEYLLIVSLLIALPAYNYAQTLTQIQGKIQNDSGESIPFASLKWKNSGMSSISDMHGSYQISLPEIEDFLTFNALGYESVTVNKIDLVNGQVTITLNFREEELQAVTVSAQKRDDLLQNIPAPVTVINSKEIERGELRILADLPALAPNLNLVDAGAPNSIIPSIRGFNAYGGEPAVGIYVDGVVQLDGNFLNQQLINVERVEVLRGPQGTLYGRNALGGVINIITKQPTNTFSGEVFTGFGNFGHQRHGIAINTPLLKDKLYLKTSGMFEKRNGFFTNAYDGRIYDGFERYAGNASLQWNIDDKWKAVFSFNYNVDDHDGIYPYHTSIEQLRENGYTINLNEEQAYKRTINRNTLQLSRLGNKVEFTSISSISVGTQRLKGTRWEGDFSPLDFLSFEMPRDKFTNQVAMQEFRFSSHPSSSKVKWIGGLNGFFQKKDEGIVTVYGQDVPPPQSEEDPIPGSRFINFAEEKNYGLAGFGEVEWSINPKWRITGGIRYDYESREATTSFDFELPPNPPINMQPEATISANFNAVTPKFTVQHQMNERLNFYAIFAQGFRAGGMNVYNPDPQFRVYDPEFSNNYELGLKSISLQNRLIVNANVFLINWRDKQLTTVLPSQGGGFQTAILNTGLLDASGFEMEVSYLPVKNLRLDYNLGYTHAVFKDLPVAEGLNFEGNFQPFQPQYTSMGIVQYDFKLSNNINAFVRGEWRALGKQYFDFENNSLQEAYSLFNARTGLSYNRFNLDFWIRNIANTEYIQFGYSFLGFENYLLGAPRTFGSTLSVKF